jgi:C4-dicarboxylate transporter
MEEIGCCEKIMLMKTLVSIYAICAVVLFLAEMVLFLFRKKYADSLKQDAVKREQILKSSRTVVKKLRILLWLTPVCVVILPLSIYWLGWDWLFYMEIIVISMYLMILLMFFTRRWIIQYLEK